MKPESKPSFEPLSRSMLTIGTGFCRPYFDSPNQVEITSCALEVMTDLRFVPAVTIKQQATVASASQKMIARGVRLLLVVDESSDVVGLMTARDLEGSRIKAAADSTGLRYGELKVRDVMTTEVEVMPMDPVLYARVGDIVETLKHSGRQHAVVADKEPFTGKTMIRGIFSASQICRQLGISAPALDLSRTFAQIDQAISELQAHPC